MASFYNKLLSGYYDALRSGDAKAAEDYKKIMQKLAPAAGVNLDNYQGYGAIDQLYQAEQGGFNNEFDYQQLYSNLNSSGYNLTPDQQQWLNNMMQQQVNLEAREHQDERENTQIIRSAEQYEQLGLSGSNVLQGGLASVGHSQPASLSNNNPAMNRAQMDLQNKQNVFNRMISMITGLTSAGIGGAALYAGRTAAARIAKGASQAATKSAFGSIPSLKGNAEPTMDWDDMIAELSK